MSGRSAAFVRGLLALLAVAALTGCSHLVVLRDPLSASEHNDLGVAYEYRGQRSLAAAQYHRSLRIDPHQARVWINLGNVAAADGRWPAAEKSYRRALREAPDEPDAMNNLAIALLRQRRATTEARDLAERAVAAGGERAAVYQSTLDEACAMEGAPWK